MSNSRTRRTSTSVMIAALLFAVAGVAAGNTTEGNHLNPPPVSEGPPGVTVLDSEVAAFASEMEVSLATARAMLGAQAVLGAFAQSVRSNPWYSGFEIVNDPPDVRGILAGTDSEGVVIPDGLPVTMVVARISESQKVGFGLTTSELLRRSVMPNVQGVTYDPTSDTISVGAPDTNLSAEEKSEIVDFLRAESPEVFLTASIVFRLGEAGHFNYGGLRETNPGNCTSGFGVEKTVGGTLVKGYLTAGHCSAIGCTGWQVHHPSGLKTVTAYHNLSVSTQNAQDSNGCWKCLGWC